MRGPILQLFGLLLRSPDSDRLYVQSGAKKVNAVLDLTVCRDLLKVSDRLRSSIVKGQARGVALCVKNADGSESVIFAGSYLDDPEGALKAAMAMSWEMTKADGPTPSQ